MKILVILHNKGNSNPFLSTFLLKEAEAVPEGKGRVQEELGARTVPC